MIFAGIDVGTKKSPMAIIRKDKATIFENYEMGIGEKITAVGIDAPLSFPAAGLFRECEKELIKRGIKLFPSGANFFRNIVEKGIKISEEFKNFGVEVFEVYPFATRKILGIAPNCNKRKSECLELIKKGIETYVSAEINNHDEADAVLSALTVKMFYEGKGEIVNGNDGNILIPKL